MEDTFCADAGSRPPREPHPDDWICPGCSKNNYASRTECFSCKIERPEGLGTQIDPNAPPRERYIPAEFLEGDAIFDERNELYDGTGINFKDYDNIPVNVSQVLSCSRFTQQ